MRRLAIVLSHPVQYYSPWFRWLRARAPLEFRVFYLWEFGATARRDPQFGAVFQWDVDLLSGYDSEFVPNVARDPGTHHFGGLDNPALTARLAAWRPDALLLFGYNWRSHQRALWWARRRGVPLLFRGDSHLLGRAGLPFLRGLGLRFLYRQFAAFTYVGAANRDYFRALGVPDRKLHFAPHSVDAEHFAPGDPAAQAAARQLRLELGLAGKRVVLFAGKFAAAKQPVELLAAFLAVATPADALVFVGDGAEKSRLASLAATRPAACVRLLPFANQSEMPARYLLADIFALPSRGHYETWGLAVNEAMHLGVPCLVSDLVGCQRDLVRSGETGWVFPAADPAALGRTLQAALRAPAHEVARLGRNALAAMAGYTYRQTSDGLLAALASLPPPLTMTPPADVNYWLTSAGGVNRLMRITIVNGFFLPVPPVSGGSTEKSWFNLGREFADRGHTVTMISRRWRDFPDDETRDGIRHLRLPGWDHQRRLWRNLLLDFLWSWRVFFHLPDADIVVVNTVALPVWLGWLKPRAGRVVIMTGRMPKGQYRRYRRIARVLAASSFVRDRVLAENPGLGAATRVCGYPINWRLLGIGSGVVPTGLPPADPGEVVLGFVGRIHEEKGLGLLSDALHLLAARPGLPPWRLLLCGPSDVARGGSGAVYRGQLQQRLSTAINPTRFNLLDPQFNERTLAGVYQRIQIFCYPSLAEQGETFGVAVAEAMAAGAVPVVSRLACFTDFVRDGHNGLVFDHAVPDAAALLAEALVRLLTDAGLRQRLAAAARADARRYDYAAYAEDLLADFALLTAPAKSASSAP
ncbi:MAG: glycosyltransferase family 4 protein [Opitutae bacterium]|nr:glycosyltransferase family 4 protein [Opitutae bacterium]